jgi:regulator of replication initiation timing
MNKIKELEQSVNTAFTAYVAVRNDLDALVYETDAAYLELNKAQKALAREIDKE